MSLTKFMKDLEIHIREVEIETERLYSQVMVAKVERSSCVFQRIVTKERECTLKNLDYSTLICDNCSRFSHEDALYSRITGRSIEPTYEWWYDEWTKGYSDGLSVKYAFERMLTYVTETTLTMPERKHIRKLRNASKYPEYVWIRFIPRSTQDRRINWDVAVVYVSLVALVMTLLQVIITWITS